MIAIIREPRPNVVAKLLNLGYEICGNWDQYEAIIYELSIVVKR